MKMYILVKDKAPLGIAMVSVAHASLACYTRFDHDPDMKDWLSGKFNKVICKVTDDQFEAAKKVSKNVVLTESAWGGREVVIAFCPRQNWPPTFSNYLMYV